MQTKTAIITGGAGFIGSHLADRLLEEGYAVRIIDDESTGSRDNVPAEAEYHRGDIRDPGELARVLDGGADLVCHVAGQASNLLSFQDPARDLAINLTGTVNVVQQCVALEIPRLLYASSMSVYGAAASLPCSERDLCEPTSYYGISKHAAERFVLATGARQDLGSPLATTAFRMFNVYGERQSLDNPYQGVMAIFMANALRGAAITIHGDGEQSRDFIHVDDVVAAWVASIDEPRTHQGVFNVGTGRRISLNTLADEILTATGKDRRSYPVRYAAARPGDQRHMEADVGALREVLGWQPRVTLEAGMARTLRWARAQG